MSDIDKAVEWLLYDARHDCDDFSYIDGRCYHWEDGERGERGRLGEMCRYEPRCHDENVECKRYRSISTEEGVRTLTAELALRERMVEERDEALRLACVNLQATDPREGSVDDFIQHYMGHAQNNILMAQQVREKAESRAREAHDD